MKQFYETYRDNPKLSPLVAEIPWTNNLLIMTACKTDEAKDFYIRACIENRYSKRELERQIDSMLYERTAISDARYGALTKETRGFLLFGMLMYWNFLISLPLIGKRISGSRLYLT